MAVAVIKCDNFCGIDYIYRHLYPHLRLINVPYLNGFVAFDNELEKICAVGFQFVNAQFWCSVTHSGKVMISGKTLNNTVFLNVSFPCFS
jgi:hypothetical protein